MSFSLKIVYKGGIGEIIEKKSRFIAQVFPIQTEEEALTLLAGVRKKHYDARHNCFAYVLGEKNETERCSDDGEPQGTAGKPMLDVLLGEGIHNAAVVVTRYFGGVLLGTGGLVRAYSGAVKAGLASSVIITRMWGVKLVISTDYTGLGKIQYILGQRGICILNSEYTDTVRLEVLLADDIKEQVKAEITEGTNGQAGLCETEKLQFAEIGGVPTVL